MGKLRPVSAVVAALLLSGCGTTEPEPSPQPVDSRMPSAAYFDATTAGTIEGRVVWEGPVPEVAPFEVVPIVEGIGLIQEQTIQRNPNRPIIDPKTRGVRNAIVFLRGVDLQRARPWDHPPVRIELKNQQFRIIQGKRAYSFGVVRRGDSVEMLSRDRVFHGIHARGAAFFSLLFPDPDRLLRRTLPDAGVVELSSAAGLIWMRAYLFVDDHPYYCCTTGAGRFRLDNVPPGEYELVAWLPSWHVVRQDRDPESCQVVRVTMGPPAEVRTRLTLGPKETRPITLTVSADKFEPQSAHH